MASLLTLAEAKAALRITDSDAAKDKLLKSFVEGVTSVVEAEVGWVAPRAEIVKIRPRGWDTQQNGCEVRRGGREVALPGFNIISLTSGEYDRTSVAIDVSGMIVSPGGILRYLSGASLPVEPWTLTLEVGMNPVPEAIKRAAAEILLLAWATQRQMPNKSGDNDGPPAFLIPYRAAAWLAGYESGPGFA